MPTVDDCSVMDLPTISRPEGNITPVEGGQAIPFDIARVYFLYDIVAGAERGGHAHRELQQLIVSVMGGFVVRLDDGFTQRSVELKRPHQGLYLPTMIWREIVDFTSGAVCLVLASLPYAESDYIREYDVFVRLRRAAADSPETQGSR